MDDLQVTLTAKVSERGNWRGKYGKVESQLRCPANVMMETAKFPQKAIEEMIDNVIDPIEITLEVEIRIYSHDFKETWAQRSVEISGMIPVVRMCVFPIQNTFEYVIEEGVSTAVTALASEEQE